MKIERYYYIWGLALLALVSSCRVRQEVKTVGESRGQVATHSERTSTASSAGRNPRFIAYIQRYHKEAIRQMQRHQIPASIKMAQGLVETGAGSSRLASEHNNHFGIKCHNTWTGRKTYKTDDRPDECFRSYTAWQDSYEDHSLFLKRPRYARLFALPLDDYRSWARGLQMAGYATNKAYANMLIKVIEDYQLYALDQGQLPEYMGGSPIAEQRGEERDLRSTRRQPEAMRPIYKSYGLRYILARRGESMEQIARELGLSTRKLAEYNEILGGYSLQEGEVVYLERKNSYADRKHPSHLVQIGESMHSIAQCYGIRMERLYKLNDKSEDYVPEEGDLLLLR